jgi:sulfur-oxidizing protein SoxY
MTMHTRRQALHAAAGAALAPLLTRAAAAQTPVPADPWPALAAQVFDGRPIGDGAAALALDAPYRAEDAALVPVGIALTAPALRRVTLLIDQNPSPLAATVEFGPDSGIDRLATRVRVDDYTNIHAVAERDDGALLAVSRFVKAAGGCSAPAATVAAGGPPPGTMRFRLLPDAADAPAGLREARIMIRHPNNSGMQMDQITRLYIPAHFITRLRLWQGERPLIALEGGISLAENPQLRFRFRPDPAAPFLAEAEDNTGARFHAEWPAATA